MSHRSICPAAVLAAVWLSSAPVQAQTKPPKTQLWIDLSTSAFAGMPEMDLGDTAGGMLGGLLGRVGGGAMGLGTSTSYGQARGLGLMGRVLDVALYNSLKPGTEARQLVPPGLRMGESLPLLPPRAPAAVKESEPGEPGESTQERPRGRILIYWGCGASVRTGQPRVIDLAGNPLAFAGAFAGRFAPDRGARVNPSFALYPNERNQVSVRADSSMVGEHKIMGEGVPASMAFTLGAAQDLMPRIDLQTAGSAQTGVSLSWQPVPQARAYFANAFGAVGDDMVMWSSAEVGDTGMGLFDYLPNPTIDRWLRDKVLLSPATTTCQIPKGIFTAQPSSAKGGEGGAMVRMIAFGGETNLVHPPRPADPKAPWEPEWAVRVRVKSQITAALGGDDGGDRGRSAGKPGTGPATPAAEGGRPADAADPGGLLPNPVNLLKGLFGR